MRTLADNIKSMNIPAPETDNTHVHLQTMLLRVRNALNECPADPQLTLSCLRGWLEVRTWYEEEKKSQSEIGNLVSTASRSKQSNQ
jgi:hypothetical protein